MIEDLKQVRDALELCRFSLEPYDDIKPRDWSTDRQNLRFAHEDAKKALSTLDRIIAEQTQDASKMVVPDGYKLVPIDPTDLPCGLTMPLPDGRIIGENQRIESIVSIEDAYKCAEILHKAMLSAAPTPDIPENVDVEKLKRKVPKVPTHRLLRPCELQAIMRAEMYNKAIDHLAAAEHERVKKERDELAKFVVVHIGDRIGFYGDHACRECFPNSDMIVDGFLCGLHKAKKVSAENGNA